MTPIVDRLGRLGTTRRHLLEALEQNERDVAEELARAQAHPRLCVSDAASLLPGLSVEDCYQLLERRRRRQPEQPGPHASGGLPAPPLAWWQLRELTTQEALQARGLAN